MGFAERVFSAEGRTLVLGGPMVDYYPQVTGGFHVSGTVGVGIVDDRGDEEARDVGLGLSAGVGYQWWLGQQWSAGPQLRLAYAPGRDAIATALCWEFLLH